jgi:hypothetical protein
VLVVERVVFSGSAWRTATGTALIEKIRLKSTKRLKIKRAMLVWQVVAVSSGNEKETKW